MRTLTILIVLSIVAGGGYTDNWGNEVPGLITNETWMTSTPQYTYGKMTFYGVYSMDATAKYRNIDYKEKGCIGGVSLMSPIDIGRKVWIKTNNQWYGPFCSVDCARKGEMYSIVVIREEVVEVNFEFAEMLGMVEHLGGADYNVNEWMRWVEVFLPPTWYQSARPEDFQLKEPINYPEWFLNNVEFTDKKERWIIDMGGGQWKEYGIDKWYGYILTDYLFYNNK